MSAPLAKLLSSRERAFLKQAVSAVQRGVARREPAMARRLSRYVRRLHDAFRAYCVNENRPALRRALRVINDDLVGERLPLRVVLRVPSQMQRAYRDLFHAELTDDPRLLRRALRLLDKFIEDELNCFANRLEHTEQARLREAEKRHIDFFANTIFPAFLATSRGRIQTVNDAFLRLFGRKMKTAKSKTVCQMLAMIGVDRRSIRAYWKRVREDGYAREMPIAACLGDDKRVFLQISSTYTRSPQGRINGLQGMIHDVTSRTLLAQQLERTVRDLEDQTRAVQHYNNRLKAVFDASPAGLIFVTNAGAISNINPVAAEAVGFCITDEAEGAPAAQLRAFASTNVRDPEGLVEMLDRIDRDPMFHGEGKFELIEPHRHFAFVTLPVLARDDSVQGRLWVLNDTTINVQNAELEEELTHMIIHDLKNPLTAIRGAADVIRLHAGDSEPTIRECAEIASRNIKTMMSMIVDLLDVHRFEKHEVKPELEPVDIDAMLREEVRSLHLIAGERSVSLRLPKPPGLPKVMADANMIKRVLSNLFTNAAKHCDPREGRITVSADLRPDGSVRVSVRDNGEGVAPEHHERIFEKFQQVSGSRGAGSTNMGLGLTFCKMAITSHGGTIGVTSKESRGSTFYFTLPVRPPADE